MNDFYFKQVKKVEEIQKLLKDNSIAVLYKTCFNEPPYEEDCDDEEICSLFLDYIKKGILLFCFEKEKDEIIGFAAAVPLKYNVEIAKLAKSYGYDPCRDWYHADLGTAKKFRRRGIAETLVKYLIQLIPANRIIMRTQENNFASRICHQRLGFQIIEGMNQNVFIRRVSGNVTEDRRIFLSYIKCDNEEEKRN